MSIVKKAEASFSYLQDWYSKQYTGEQRPPLVFVIQVRDDLHDLNDFGKAGENES